MQIRSTKSENRASRKASPPPTDNLLPTFFDRQERERMIAEAAYFAAEQRGFQPGHEVIDWLAAERQIDELLTHSHQS